MNSLLDRTDVCSMILTIEIHTRLEEPTRPSLATCKANMGHVDIVG
jgi:hypothetical protein